MICCGLYRCAIEVLKQRKRTNNANKLFIDRLDIMLVYLVSQFCRKQYHCNLNVGFVLSTKKLIVDFKTVNFKTEQSPVGPLYTYVRNNLKCCFVIFWWRKQWLTGCFHKYDITETELYWRKFSLSMASVFPFFWLCCTLRKYAKIR